MQPNDTELQDGGQNISAVEIDGPRPIAPVLQAKGDAVGQARSAGDGQALDARPSPPDREVVGHARHAEKANLDLPAPRDTHQICAEIRSWHRRRCFAMEQRKRADLALGAFLRTQLGWSLNLPAAERERIADQAAALVKQGEREVKGKAKPIDEPAYAEWRDIIVAAILSRQPFSDIEDRAHKEMERLAKTLPAWASFGDGVRGFGPASLAVIVGEAGNLSGYATHSKLWKRMGLAVMGDVRQGGLAKNAPKEAWIEHGYNRQRRSRMWNIGACLWKTGERYRELFLERCAKEHAKAVAEGLIPATTQQATVESWTERGLPPLQKITEKERVKNPDRYRTAGHMKNRAQRYAEKRLLRDLWRAWRAALCCVPQRDEATTQLPPVINPPTEGPKSRAGNGLRSIAPVSAELREAAE